MRDKEKCASKRAFFSDLYLFIDQEAEKLAGEKLYLTYQEFKSITLKIRIRFRELCQAIPKEIEIACDLAEAIMSPSRAEKKKILKHIVLIGGGGGSIALMIPAIGAILGWGGGVTAWITAVLLGVNLVPIAGQIAMGGGVVLITAYFWLHRESSEVCIYKTIKALKASISKVEDSVWEEMKNTKADDDPYWFG